MELKSIGELADVMVGLVIKRKKANINSIQKFSYRTLNLKCLTSDGWIEDKDLDLFYYMESLNERYLTIRNDIIIKLTQPYTAVTITKETEGYVVPSQFIIIRPKSSCFIPNYLTLFLNTERMKNYINVSATGITVPMIKTSTLREMKVPIIDKEKQNIISEMGELIIKERKILRKLLSEKEKYYNATIEAIIMEDK